MPAPTGATVLITGANTGIGEEVARQLASRADTGRILLACRDEAKAHAARADLERVTGRSIFEVVVLDLVDTEAARRAVAGLDRPLDAVVMNAGGTGGPTPMALTRDGVTTLFASNVLGHVVLLERLLDAGLLTGVAVLAGSEAARGVPKMRIPRPTFTDHSPAEFASVVDGSYFRDRRYHPMLAYGQVKYLGALWMSALARRHPERRLLTVSPGNTAGTEAMRDQPPLLRALAQRVVLPHLLPLLRMGHDLEHGAGRLVAGVTDATMAGGVFHASAAHTVTGPLVDQADIVPELRDPRVQDHADEAIHRFLR